MIFLDFFKKNKLHNNMYDINILSTLNVKICAHIEMQRRKDAWRSKRINILDAALTSAGLGASSLSLLDTPP